MKWVRFEQNGAALWGEAEGERIFPLTGAPYSGGVRAGEPVPLAGAKFLAPCEPTKIVCVGKNYYDHALEFSEEVPDHPILFLKGPNTVNRPEGAITAPDFVQRLDYEGELAFVVKKRAKNVKKEDWRDYILGYTILNDVTARDVQSMDGQWTRAKTMDGFAPIGPWETDEADPADLAIVTRLNGRVVQSSRTSKFMTPLPEMLAFITASMTLEPGDVVTTGTPAGIGPMVPGDQVEIEVEGIGVLRNFVE